MPDNSQLAAMPPQVRLAINLLWLYLLIVAVRAIARWTHLHSHPGAAAFMMFFMSMLACLIWKIGQGRNWARITYLVLFIPALLAFPFVLWSMFHRSPVSAYVSIAGTALEGYALLLLFRPSSTGWFQQKKTVS